jgi:hypothetical protein
VGRIPDLSAQPAEATVQQTSGFSAEVEVDFGEFSVAADASRSSCGSFFMRLRSSGCAHHVAYVNREKESFLDAYD